MRLTTLTFSSLLLVSLVLTGCFPEQIAAANPEKKTKEVKTEAPKVKQGRELATFGAGCFWCIEAALDQLEGVDACVSGYMGGKTENPTYKDICRGDTGHAEVVQVLFDPKKVSYDKLLSYFWKVHDPTTLNRQGNDIGTQYRSAIFYHSDEQKAKAEAQIKKVNESKVFKDPVVTEVSKVEKFYPAEDYHQNYYEQNKNNPNGNIGYCRYMIAPKLEKLGLEK